MAKFGNASRFQLDTCEPRLVDVCELVILHSDFTVIWGRRGEEEQNEAYRLGNSTKEWPHSKHNAEPPLLSQAVDIAPWHGLTPHIRWENEREFVMLAGRMIQAGYFMGVKIRWGGNWDMDSDLYDLNKPFDLGHFELLS